MQQQDDRHDRYEGNGVPEGLDTSHEVNPLSDRKDHWQRPALVVATGAVMILNLMPQA